MPRNMPSGEFDRRIIIQECLETNDSSGDPIQDWPPDGGTETKRWAKKRDGRPGEMATSQQVVRQVDTVWTTRWDSFTQRVGPETHRILHEDRRTRERTIYEIVGLAETNSREDGVAFLCCRRPDQRGARAPIPPGT